MTFRTANALATQRLAMRLAALLQPGDVIGLIGDLGAGKTAFVKGLAKGLGIEPTHVGSPTFTLVNEYRGGRLLLHHVDLYRLEREDELGELGLEELVGESGVVAIEWIDRFPAAAGADWLEVRIDFADGDARVITVRGTGPRAQALAAAWK